MTKFEGEPSRHIFLPNPSVPESCLTCGYGKNVEWHAGMTNAQRPAESGELYPVVDCIKNHMRSHFAPELAERICTAIDASVKNREELDATPAAARAMSETSVKKIAAIAYQICGVLEAPARILDYFSAVANGEKASNPLPFSPDELVKPSREIEHLRQRLEEVEKERDKAHKKHLEIILSMQAEIDDSVERADRLEKALREYGQHKDGCDYCYSTQPCDRHPCTCGLEAALKEGQ